jgi:signal transduction histidine kinase
VQKHAQASHVEVVLRDLDRDTVQLEIVDDGRGFDVDSLDGAYEEGHFGVRMLSDVVNAAGGELELKSTPGAGTTLTLVAPR